MGSTTPAWLPLVVAGIAAVAMLRVARLTWAREREARRAEHESQRLADLLDAALDLRDTLSEMRVDADPGMDVLRAHDRAEAVFLARTEAVGAYGVRAHAEAWVEAAVAQAEGLASGEEPAAWRAFLVVLGRARRHCA